MFVLLVDRLRSQNGTTNLVESLKCVLNVADHILANGHVLNLVYKPHDRFERLRTALDVLQCPSPEQRVELPVCERLPLDLAVGAVNGLDVWRESGHA